GQGASDLDISQTGYTIAHALLHGVLEEPLPHTIGQSVTWVLYDQEAALQLEPEAPEQMIEARRSQRAARADDGRQENEEGGAPFEGGLEGAFVLPGIRALRRGDHDDGAIMETRGGTRH